jgi:hypothetical protein
MPYNKDQVELVMESYYTKEFYGYDTIWTIEDIDLIETNDLDYNPVSIVHMKFKRNIKSYIYTMPSYIVYILTLLMFLLPQQSNQRLIIGVCLFICLFNFIIIIIV